MRAARAALLLALALPSPAVARVTVAPEQPRLNVEQEIAVRVTPDGDAPTTAVSVAFPGGLAIGAFAPAPGWTRRGSGRGVAYTGGRIARGEYADFRLLATPRRAGRLAFRVTQTSADGTVRRSTPAIQALAIPDAPAPSPTVKKESSDAAIWLGVIAIVIALASALAVGFLWSTRPIELPPDET